MDCVLVHLGSILCLQCMQDHSENGASTTKLSVSLFKFQPHDNTFKKSYFSGSPILETKLEGHFTIIEACKVDCHVTGVLQPCLVLQNQIDNAYDGSTILEIGLYQVQNLKKLVKVFHICNRNEINFSVSSKVFICDGPSLVIIDADKQKVIGCKTCDEKSQLVWLQACLEKSSSFIYAFQRFQKFGHPTCQFLSQLCSRWLCVQIELNYANRRVKVLHEGESALPNVYCSFATAVLADKLYDFYFITTSRSQFISIKNQKVEDVCDIPFNNCNMIYTVGNEENQVAILVSSARKQCCFIHLSISQVVKVWDNVTYAIDGTFAISEKMTEGVLILRSNLKSNCVEQEEYSIISDVRDVLKYPKERIKEFTLKNTTLPMDTECDLFASPDYADDKFEECDVISKVIKSLHLTVSSHRTVVDHLRSSLQHCDAAIATSRKAICEMNNTVNLQGSGLAVEADSFCSGMVDLFTALPCAMEGEESSKDWKKILVLKKSWQRVICDDWILGFDFLNQSEKCLSNFAVVLSKCPSAGKDRSSIGSNFTRTFGPVPIDHKKTIKNVLACERIHPSDEFTIVAKFYLPSFTDMQENYMCSAAVIAAVHEQTQNSGSRNYCIDDIMIFNAAKVNLTATEVFANSCAINLKSWNDSITGKTLNDLKAVRTYHIRETQLTLSSDRTDVLAACQELLRSLGFAWMEHFELFVCLKIGPLYLVLVKLQQILATEATLQICSKSKFEASLLTRYFNEQIDLKIIDTT